MTLKNRDRRPALHGIAMALAVWPAFSGPAVAQVAPVVDARIVMYRTCPQRGVVWSGSPSWNAERDSDEDRPRAITPDSPEWVEPDPIAESELRAPEIWTPPASASEPHRALWREVGLTLSDSGLQVRRFREFAHHGSHWFESLIATRSDAGLWQVEELRVHRSRAIGPPPAPEIARWTLSAPESRRIDGRLADTCLDAEPLQSDHWTDWIIAGAMDETIFEVIGREPRVAMRRIGAGFGRSEEILHILYRARSRKEDADQ